MRAVITIAAVSTTAILSGCGGDAKKTNSTKKETKTETACTVNCQSANGVSKCTCTGTLINTPCAADSCTAKKTTLAESDSCNFKQIDPATMTTGNLAWKDENCALSSACCKSMQAYGTLDLKKFTDPAEQKKAAAMAVEAGKHCANADDMKAGEACRKAGRWTTGMLLVEPQHEPQQMMVGFGGFLAGAAVMGLAIGLKKRSQVALEEPLTA